MPDLTGIHANAQAQSSTSAADISKLAEKMAEGLTEATLDGLVHAFQTIQNLRKNNKESQQLPDNSVVPQSLAERKENLKHLKDRLNNETREFRRDVRKNAVKVGLNYILSLFKNVKKFLKDTWEAPGIFTRGIKNKFSSLKDFMLAETKGEVKIGQEIKGNKQEQAEKFIKLLNTSAGEQAPEGLENTIIAPWGENLIVVDENNNVTANLIQPLMNSEVVQLAIDRNTVAAVMAPNIQPVASSLASQELNLQGQLIGQDAINRLLKNIQDNQLSKSTIQGLENLLSEPSQVQLEVVPVSIEQPLVSVSVEAENAVVVDNNGVVVDPFNEPEIQAQKQSIKYRQDFDLLENRDFCDGLVGISDLHDRYASENESSQVLSVRGEGSVGYEYDSDLEEYIEQYYEQSVDIVAVAASISENKVYFLKDKENGQDILYFEIEPDGHIIDVTTNLESSYNNVGLVSALSEIAIASELSKWKIIDISKQLVVEVGEGEVVTPETQPVVITKAQLEDLSDDRSHDLKDVVYASLDKNDEFGSRLEKMKDAADKFIMNDEYVALEQFETTNLQALVHKLESNITAEEVNIPEFAKHLAENPNSLPQDQETDLKSIQTRTEKLADAKALLTFIEAKYPAQQTANDLDKPKYTLIDLSLSELIVERDAAIDRAVIPYNSALTAETRQQNLDRVLANPKYGEIQSSAIETVLTAIQTNTERLEHNRGENLGRIDRKNIVLTEAQQLEDRDKIEDLTREVDKLTKFDEYHNQELATLTQLKEYIQHPELKPVVFGLTEVPQISRSPKPLVPTVAAVNKLSSLDDLQTSTLPQPDFVAIVVTPKLANDLVTIAQLHQIGTLSGTPSLPLLQSADDKAPLLITQTVTENGSAIYQVVDVEKEFNFTVTPEQIVTNFNIRKGNNSAQIRKLVTSIANVVKAPAQTDLQPHTNSDLQRIETVQQLNGLLNETATQTDRATRSVVTLDRERFGMKIDRENRRVVITDKTTSETVAFGKNGIEDGGLLKKMTEVAKDKSSSLAQRLARVVVEKTNEAKTVLENAAPNIMAALDERATADRTTAQKVSKAVNRLGTQVDSFIGQGIRNVVAANPGMLGTIRQMKKIEQVGDATENQVSQDLQSAGEHLADSSLVRDGETQLEPSSIDEREEFQQRLSEAVVHKSPAKTSGQAMQPSH